MGKLKNVPQMLKSVTDNFSANTVLAALHPVITALIGEKKKEIKCIFQIQPSKILLGSLLGNEKSLDEQGPFQSFQ